MLKIFRTSRQLDIRKLSEIYKESIQLSGRENYRHLSSCEQLSEAEKDFYDYWQYRFFTVSNAACAVWEVSGEFVAAVRLEPYNGGLLLAGLETAPQHRRKGYGKMLVKSVTQELLTEDRTVLYAHIHKKNIASLCLHKSCGFTESLAYAVFLDGSVSYHYSTYFLKK